MKTLALVQGDLSPSPGGYRLLGGAQRIHQDLTLALREAYGGDACHPRWGSILDNFIGTPLTPDVKQKMLVEVSRVINNYITVQNARIVQDNSNGSQSSYSTDDVINGVTSITIKQVFDSIVITVGLQTVSRQQINFQQVIS